ncbi:hypothetical protein BCV72DRAFT_198385, partial [Rhizopus microsporus var. microsporus]
INNATIYKTKEVVTAIRDNRYTVLFLPPYSLFLNSIKEYWSKIKGKVRKTPLLKNKMITDGIEKAGQKVTPEDCQGWTRHS